MTAGGAGARQVSVLLRLDPLATEAGPSLLTDTARTAPPAAFLGAKTRDFALVAASVHALALEGPPAAAPPPGAEPEVASGAASSVLDTDAPEEGAGSGDEGSGSDDGGGKFFFGRAPQAPPKASFSIATFRATLGGQGFVGAAAPEGRMHPACVEFLLKRPTHPIAAGCRPAPSPHPRTKWTCRVPHPVMIGHAPPI